MKQLFFTLFTLTALGFSLSAHAIKPATEGENSWNDTPRNIQEERTFLFHEAQAASDASSMREGIVDDIDLKKSAISVRSTPFRFNAGTVKTFYGGQASHINTITKGRFIRFLLDPLDKTGRTIAVIYL